MNQRNSIEIKCLEVRQPIGEFYLAIMGWQDIIRISWADVRRIGNRDVEDYMGIQRELDSSRVDELQRYVGTVDATFPTGIILAVSSEDVIDYDETTGIMVLKDDEKVAKIIDGQHRIAGLEALKGTDVRFDLNVTIFVDMDIEDQAMVFATINLAQTRVRKSLAYDLYEYTHSRSPQKTAHNIAKLLTSEDGSPFQNRIKILGTATKKYQTLTQAAFVESLIPLISGTLEQALKDRDLIKRGKPIPPPEAVDGDKVVFREMFDEESDARIARVVWNYFSAVEERWPEAWHDVKPGGSMLPRTNAFRALMRFLPKAYGHLGGPPSVPSTGSFLQLFEQVPLRGDDFNTDRYKPGSTGERALLDDFLGAIEPLA
jgi:DGQHR domain-containing protein